LPPSDGLTATLDVGVADSVAVADGVGEGVVPDVAVARLDGLGEAVVPGVGVAEVAGHAATTTATRMHAAARRTNPPPKSLVIGVNLPALHAAPVVTLARLVATEAPNVSIGSVPDLSRVP